MKAGLSTIQQMLTPEAASVLTRAVSEAARRKHEQTTPLHVAATLLAAPSGLLRRACMSSHSDIAHPLQCRALELCFSVALDRLPSDRGDDGSAAEPKMSNALKAALKRAQANQRRGCPEQPQQPAPLLAVKVEIEQLIISILDDPSVSRVMREASFSSTAVKATIEQSVSSSSSTITGTTITSALYTSPSPNSSAFSSPSSAGALGLNLSIRAAPAHNIYMNPRLHQHQRNAIDAAAGGIAEQPEAEEVKRVMDILLRPQKRNPVLVGDVDPDTIMKEVIQKIESGAAPHALRTTKVVSFAKELATSAAGNASWITTRFREMASVIESHMADNRNVVLDLGDLKWLVESPGQAPSGSPVTRPQQVVCVAGRAAVAEMRRLLKAFEHRGRVWLVGKASCTTYLQCQVYHPSIEKDWDLQVVQIAPKKQKLPRLEVNGKHSSSIEIPAAVAPRIGLPDSISSSTSTSQELVREMEKSSSKGEDNMALPPWLLLAKLSNGGSTKSSTDHLQDKEQKLMQRQNTEEKLLKKWQSTQRSPTTTLPNPLSLCTPRSLLEPKLKLTLSQNHDNVMLNPSSEQLSSPPASPVKTDLVLGRTSNSLSEKMRKSRVQDLTKCMEDEFVNQPSAKLAGVSDIDAFKRLFKGFVEKVSWQQEAASAMATIIMHLKSENRRHPWLLFVGPDKVGKRKMAAAVSELVYGTAPTTIYLGSTSNIAGDDGESIVTSRGRTSMDRVVDAVRRNPFSVVVLEEVDQADGLVIGSIKRAMEQGRLVDSYGREVSLGSVIFIITSTWLPEEIKRTHEQQIEFEERILDSASRRWQLELSAEKNPGKRRVDWPWNSDQPLKLRRQSSAYRTGLSLDLNLAVATEDESGEGSRNSSDITTEHDHDKGRLAIRCSTLCSASELIELVDNAIMFKPVDFAPQRRNVSESISKNFAVIMGARCSLKVDEDVIDRIVGGLWIAGEVFDEWCERVLSPSLKQLKYKLNADDGSATIVRLSVVPGGRATMNGDRNWLPVTVAIAVEGL
ncbi:protein SMAX1-like [Canna indica]|uniref:Protein SMAX1-like n=1 Tax=Canna indica TaxID=4628 RepID=A0AAQ3KSC8_9LILI|nr:protein SMAX1-like [Canna indica]